MHGLVHIILKAFILDTYGADAWEEILRRLEVEDDNAILQMHRYDDDVTFGAVIQAAEVAGVDLDTALEAFGSYFVDYQVHEGFVPLLKALGSTLKEFLSNLNILHHNVERDYTAAIFPVFDIKDVEDAKGSFVLCYGSTRTVLQPLLRGALARTAEVLFHEKVDVEARRADSSLSVHGIFWVEWQVTVSKLPGQPAGGEGQTAAGRGFFDFHTLLMQLCACSCSSPVSCTSGGTAQAQAIAVRVDHAVGMSEEEHSRMLESCRHKKLAINKICTLYPPPANGEHLYFQMSARDRVRAAFELFRGVEAGEICAFWTDPVSMQRAVDFWGAYDKLDRYYAWSKDWFAVCEEAPPMKRGKIRFLSQSWGTPDAWPDVLGRNLSYPAAKAAEICCVAKDIAARELGDVGRWQEVGFWLDKCCIPQGDKALMGWCVNLLEEFMVFCDGLIVLIPWTYFTRLWCVYEWVCFLIMHDPMDIEICADPFVRENTVEHYIKAISDFSLDKCQCYTESDRAILNDKVDEYYKSQAAFERFFKLSAIALFARFAASRRSAKPLVALKPWEDLARAQGFIELELKLRQLANMLVTFRQEAVRDVTSRRKMVDLQTAIANRLDDWFRVHVVPLILAERAKAATERGLIYIEHLRRAHHLFEKVQISDDDQGHLRAWL